MVRSSPLRRDPSFVIDNSFTEDFTDLDDGWRLPLRAPSGAAEIGIGGQDTRAGLGPVEASHGQPPPISSEDTQLLRQHDAGSSQHETAFAPTHIGFPYGQSARMCCATPGRGFLGEKEARR
jgi:hypothetical protein